MSHSPLWNSAAPVVITRRAAVTALGATVLAPSIGGAAAGSQNILDVHSHYVSPAYVRELGPEGYVSENMRGWSLSALLEAMEQAAVVRSILSVTTPAIPVAGTRSQRIARELNEYGARLVLDHRPRLGLFASLPMRSGLDAALAEAAYALDILKANGIALLTSYEDRWLGDPAFLPLYEELNRRKATIFVHPTIAACCNPKLPFVRTSVIEYGTDTTRAITNYVYRGAARRFAQLRVIFCHAGGTMPFLIERFDVTDQINRAVRVAAPHGFRAEIRRFFYDVAQSSNPVATRALREVVPVTQIVFGTDYPYRTQTEHVSSLESGGVFSADELKGIYHGNVARDLPGLLA